MRLWIRKRDIISWFYRGFRSVIITTQRKWLCKVIGAGLNWYWPLTSLSGYTAPGEKQVPICMLIASASFVCKNALLRYLAIDGYTERNSISSICDFSIWILNDYKKFLAGLIHIICNTYIMELIENIVWIVGGFITTLVTMELAWKLARRQTKKSITKPILIK